MIPRVLVAAGHDPSYSRSPERPAAGAGVDADREALERFGVRAECVVTTWTEQDGTRVHAVRPRATLEWLAEARAAAREPFGALKSGLIANAEAVHALATLVDELRAAQPGLAVVVDPVLSATGGEPFLDERGIRVLLDELVPRGVILTPNLPEAARLSRLRLDWLQRHRSARIDAADTLLARGARAVVLKGGHAGDPCAADLLVERSSAPVWIARPRLPGARVHGSGCRFASALAAHLALGHPLADSAAAAGAYLATLLQASIET